MQIVNDYSATLADLIEKIESFTLFKNNAKQTIINNEEKFESIKKKLYDLFLLGRLEPAFGVSLHNLTLEEMKNGNWLQINFKTEQNKNGLPFSALLIKLEETGGFNLIRLFNGKYDGRCLYFALEKTTDLNSVIL